MVDLLGALGSGEPGEYDFAGISVWNPSVFSRIPIATRISFIPVIIEWMKSGGRIGGVALEESRWFNIGSRKEYLSAHRIIAQERWVPDYLRGSSWPIQVEPSAEISPESKIEGGSYVGARCYIEAGCSFRRFDPVSRVVCFSRHDAAILHRSRRQESSPALIWRPILYEP